MNKLRTLKDRPYMHVDAAHYFHCLQAHSTLIGTEMYRLLLDQKGAHFSVTELSPPYRTRVSHASETTRRFSTQPACCYTLYGVTNINQ
jgi:hypothetical protein